MRPMYETAADLGREMSAIEQVCQRWRCGWVKLPIMMRIDYMLERDRHACAFAEFKGRKNVKLKYSTLMISSDKIDAGLILSEMSGLPFFMLAKWSDTGIHWAEITEVPSEKRTGGRVDRDDPMDIEPVYDISIKLFRPLERSR